MIKSKKKVEAEPEVIEEVVIGKRNFTNIKGYVLVNAEKLNRALNGAMSREGQLKGGVSEEASDEEVLAEYDRLGGLVRKDNHNVKIGSFYDFKTKKPRAKAEVVLQFRDLNGDLVEVPEDEPLPLEVRAAEMAKKGKTAKPAAKKEVVADDDEE